MARVFLLSPARCAGKRADLLYNERASFELALRVRQPEGAPLGEVFSFLSGLYFRGKLAYARAFAQPPGEIGQALVITPERGLVDARQAITLADLRAFAAVPVEPTEPRYTEPLVRDARWLAGVLPEQGEVILLGSIATPKYCGPLLEVFGSRLLFPAEFAGRGDMSRGGLMLRCVDEARELAYVPVNEGIRRAARPAKLPPRKRPPQ